MKIAMPKDWQSLFISEVSDCRPENLIRMNVSQIFFKNFANIIKKFLFIIENVVTAIFGYIYHSCFET